MRLRVPVQCVLLTLVVGCTGSDPTETDPDSGPVDERVHVTPGPALTPFSEPFIAGGATAFAADAHTLVARVPGDLVAVGPDGAAIQLGVDADLYGAGRTSDGSLFVAADDLYVQHAATLVASPLAEAIPGAVRSLSTRGTDVWLGTDDAIYRYRVDDLVRVAVDGATGQFVVAGRHAGRPLVWVAAADGVFGLVADEDQFSVAESVFGEPPDSLAGDGDGNVWFVMDGELVQRGPSGGITTFVFPAPVNEVVATPSASGVWVGTESGWLLGDGSGFRPVLGVDHVVGGDGIGRLLFADATGVSRASDGRRIELVGVDAGQSLVEPTTLHVYTSDPQHLSTLTVTLDGVSQVVTEGAFTVDPTDPDAVAGLHTVEATAAFASGDPVTASVGFTLGNWTPPDWDTDIQPIYADHCAICHGGATETQLGTEADWLERMSCLLEMIDAGAMPPNGDDVAPTEFATLQTWCKVQFPSGSTCSDFETLDATALCGRGGQ